MTNVNVNEMTPEEFDFYIQSRGFATAYRVDPPTTQPAQPTKTEPEADRGGAFSEEEYAKLPPVRPMTPEEEAEYAAMEESMSFHEGGGDWRGESEAEEKPWFERDQEVHDHNRER
jgi:hypothetical protein